MSADPFNDQIDVVLAGLFINAAADLRHLAALGYTVCGIAHNPNVEGMRSRHGLKLQCPDPERDLDGWAQFMEELGRRCGTRPALIPTSDRYVLALDACAERLRPWFRFHGFGTGLRTALTSKRQTFELAARHAFPMPQTRFLERWEDLEDFFHTIGGPVLIKPEFSMHWKSHAAKERLGNRKVMTAETLSALRAAYDRAKLVSPNLVAQELIPGPDRNLIYWAGFVGPDGAVGGRLVGRKVRVLPIHYGSGSFVELADLPEVEAQCEAFLKALGYVGRCGIDLKIDARDGRAKLIEVNPRTGLWEDIGVPVGVDLAEEEIATLLHDRPVRPRRPARFDYKWVHLGRDLAAFRRYRAEGSLTMAAWLRSLTPPIVIADFPLREDPPYAWANFQTVIRSVSHRMRHRGPTRTVDKGMA